MKKITIFIVFVALLLSANKMQSQAVNEPANWPNTDWEIAGVYTVSGLTGNPLVDSNFGFDNQAAGVGSQNDIVQVSSPVYDLRNATTVVPSEEQLVVSFDYVNFQVGTKLVLKYTVGASNIWYDWQDIPNNSSSDTEYKTCDGFNSFVSDPLYISTFNDGELQTFRYAIYYDDNFYNFQLGGFCIGSPILESRVTPTCIEVQSLEVDEDTLQGERAEISWGDQNSITPNGGWEVQYGLANFTLGNGTSVITFIDPQTTPFILSDLNPTTCYDVYVRALCIDVVNDADDIFSEWVGPLNFCTPIKTPVCGDVFYDIGGPNGNYINNPEDEITIIYPENTGDVVTVLFDEFDTENGTDTLSIYDSDVVGTNLLGTYSGTSLPPMTSATVANGGALTFVFHTNAVQVRSGWKARIFCSPPITCFMPENLAVNQTSIGIHDAEVSWSDTNVAVGEPTSDWDIEYGPIGFEQGTGVLVHATTNPFTLTGLVDATEYCFYVKADCGSIPGEEDSFWQGPKCFTTLCDIFPAPYSENFDNNGDTPICWKQGLGNNETWNFSDDVTAPGHVGNAGNVNGTTTLSGGYFAWVDDDNPNSLNTELISPFIDLTGLTTPTLIFYYLSNHEFLFSSVNFSVDLWNETTSTLHEEIFTHTGNTLDWEQAFVDLSAYDGDTIQLRFIVDEVGFSIFDDFAIDDVFVGDLPDCINVNSVNIENVGSNDVVLSWNEGNTPASTNWQIVYGAPGIDPNTETPINVNDNTSYVLNGLTDQTNYDLYIRSDCGAGSYSLWVGPVQFRTLCPVFSAPYTEDFSDGGFLDSCWTQSSVIAGTEWQFANNVIVPGDLGDGGNVFGTTTDSNDYFAYVENDAPKVLNNSISTPLIDITPLATPTLYFYYISFSTNNVAFSIDVWDGAAWNLDFFTSSSNTAGWEETILDLTSLAITGPIQVKFTVDENNGAITTDDFAIDDVRIDNEPDCWPIFSPAVFNATTTTMDISWMDNDNDVPPTTYYIEYGDVGFTLGTGTIQNVDMSAVSYNPYTITGLPVDTDFDFYVFAACPNGESMVGPVQGATLPTCFEITGFNSFNETTTTVDATWNDNNPVTPIGGWDIEITYPGFDQGTGFVSTVFTNTVTLDDNFVNSSMIPSSTYEVYIRANCATGDADSSRWSGPFVINTQIGPPLNDTCANAILIVAASEETPILVNNIQATQTVPALDTECSDPAVSGLDANFDLFDVWYKFIVPTTGTVMIKTGFAGVADDTAMAVYKGSCGSFTPAVSYYPDLTTINSGLKSCRDDVDMNPLPGYPDDSNLFTKIVVQNVTPGDEYYIRVWTVDRTNVGQGNNQGQFTISLLGTPAANRSFLAVEEEVVVEDVILNYYPNPVSNMLKIKSNIDMVDIHVYSILGQEVYKKEISSNNSIETELDMNNLHSGTYFIKVLLSNNITKTIKVIKE